MNVAGVSEWLRLNGYDKYVKEFEVRRIDGKAMLEIVEAQGTSGFATLCALLPLEKKGDLLILLSSIRSNKEGFKRVASYVSEKTCDLPSGFKRVCTADVSEGNVGFKRVCTADVSEENVENNEIETSYEYSTDVMAGLRKKDMNVYQRFNMMRDIATKLVHTNPNPTMEDLRIISSQVFQKWPFLSHYGTGDYFSIGILEELKRLHKSGCYKTGFKQINPPLKEKKCYVDGENSSTEDLYSVDRHIKFMQKKMGKKYKDMNTVLSIMDKTFINRRDWIKSEGVSVKAAVETYPALATIDGIFHEINTILDCNLEMVPIWGKCTSKILNLAISENIQGGKEPHCQHLYAFRALFSLVYKGDKKNNSLKYKKCIYKVKEKISEEDFASAEPAILDSAGFLYLTAEKTVITKLQENEAIPALVATYYIYDMKYPTDCEQVFQILERIFSISTVGLDLESELLLKKLL